jgi:sulfoxide reductase heme-binding subunit YedZ
MTQLLKANRRFLIFNTFAIFVLIYVLTQGSSNYGFTAYALPELESGKWAIRFLLICLAMTPLRILFGWNSAIKLRKSAGLWCFFFACFHLAFYSLEVDFGWLDLPQPLFIILGLIGMSILLALAATSNRWAMRHLKKNWKRLHRLVYGVGFIVLVHALLATTQSKKVLSLDPNAATELSIYLVILILLLLIRIPFVKQQISHRRVRQTA